MTLEDRTQYDPPLERLYIVRVDGTRSRACNLCWTVFVTVNSRRFFTEAQEEYYREQRRKRRLIEGN